MFCGIEKEAFHASFFLQNFKQKPAYNAGFASGDPKENRTPDSALRGRRLDRLTIGPWGLSRGDYSMPARSSASPVSLVPLLPLSK